ncbi:MAG: PRD domain-containing protein [Erysipelotrichaceae bacterium]|nr:PRD domain-containing protein [Erysipelotrichaceae bacterium]
MKVIKNINNNVAICEDSLGNEVVAFGKGIGFREPPYDYDIKDIERTFYNVDSRYLELVADADEEIMNVAMEIRDHAVHKGLMTGNNLFFSLVDHITFALKRQREGIQFTLPIKDDIRFKFPDEMEIGRFALKRIREELKVLLPADEACYIALNILNSETEASDRQEREARTIREITDIISKEMGISINEDSVSYSRFASHMHYLLQKSDFGTESNYTDLLNTMRSSNEKEYQVALKVREYLMERSYGELSEDEILFLTLHITRLCQREN